MYLDETRMYYDFLKKNVYTWAIENNHECSGCFFVVVKDWDFFIFIANLKVKKRDI